MANRQMHPAVHPKGTLCARAFLSPREKVQSQRTRSMLKNLKASFLHACGPPGLTSGAAVHEQRSEAEFGPRLIGDYHEQKISAGFYYTGGFRERLIDPLAIKVIDRILADDCIEGSAFEGKFAYVSGLDCGPLVHARGFQGCKQALLRTLTPREVLFERISEDIQLDNTRLRTRSEDHN